MKKQQGFVSIIVASILVIILTLIVLGFSRIMDREQRQALDRQLSTQAFYAAETAVNDVYEKMSNGTLPMTPKTSCDVQAWPTPGANGAVDAANGVSYTCLMYDQTPSTLSFGNGGISTQESKIFPIQNANGGNIETVKFEWSREGGVKTIAANLCPTPQSLPSSQPNNVPILRVELVPLPTTSSIARDTIINATTYYYLIPTSSGCGTNTTTYSTNTAAAEKGKLINVNCNSAAEYACSFEIQSMGVAGSNRFIARIKSIYANADMRIGATTPPPSTFEFLGAQVQIDATGKASDVVRRINVNLGIPNYPIPEFVVQGMDGVCKNLSIVPPSDATYSCSFN